MAVMYGDVLPALYFLALFLLGQFQFLEICEAFVFNNEEHDMKTCPSKHSCQSSTTKFLQLHVGSTVPFASWNPLVV